MENNTNSFAYFEELRRNTESPLRRVLPVQLPYQLNLRRLVHGKTLEVGSGLGRNLRTLPPGSVGLDHNQYSVAYCQRLGLDARLLTEPPGNRLPLGADESFDTLLLAHVLEHVEWDQQLSLIQTFLPFLNSQGHLVLITPQEKGHAATSSHISWTDTTRLLELIFGLNRSVARVRSFSFPFHRIAGRWFTHNEFIVCAQFA